MEYDTGKWIKYGNHLLNKKLVQDQNLSKEQITRILRIYNIIDKLYEKAKKVSSEKEKLKNISIRIENLEYTLQSLWGFPPSEKYHKYNLNIPGCTCPVMDNAESYGYRKIYNCECNVHWWKCSNESE